MTFGLNVAMFPRANKSDVATLKSNVATFQGGLATDVVMLGSTLRRYKRGCNWDQPTSRRSGSTSRRDRDYYFRSSFNVATLQRR